MFVLVSISANQHIVFNCLCLFLLLDALVLNVIFQSHSSPYLAQRMSTHYKHSIIVCRIEL